MDGTGNRGGGVLRARLRRAGPTAPAKPAPLPVPPPAAPSVERVAANAAARAAGRAGRLSATAEAVASQGLSLSELPELLPERALIAVIEAGGERLGVAALCPALLASLIEVQAIGHVTGRPFGARRPTRADAALAADFVNHLLDEFGQSVAALPGHAALAGYRYASYLDDPRPLALMLEDTGFRAIRVDLRLGAGGERRGTLFVAVPATPAGEGPSRPLAAGPPVAAIASSAPRPGTAPEAEAAPASLAASVRLAPVPLVAVLCRRRITLRELRALKPGATIALPRAAVDDAWLETGRGQKLARGKLGESDGFHALRLRPRDLSATAGGGAAMGGAGNDGGVDHASAQQPPLPVASLRSGTPAPSGLAAPETEPPMADLAVPDAFRLSPDTGEAAVLPMQVVS